MRCRLLWMRGLLAVLLLACSWPLRSANYGQLPLSFEPNQGQAEPQIQYLARGQGYGLFLGPHSATLRLVSKSRVADLRINLDGTTGQPRITGEDPLPGTSRYYRGKDAGQWIAGVPTFQRVRYEAVYPGVDLVFYGNQRSLEYDFVLMPGASARPILLSLEGANGVRVEPSGDLLLEVPGGQVRLLKPVAYQQSGGRRLPVSARYRVKGTQVGFQLGSYDRALPVIIDPTLNYSTYLGGSGLDGANAIAVDSSGNAYVAGWTASANLPVTTGTLQSTPAGLTDAFVAKIGPAGTSLLFSTYLGGSGDDYGEGIALDPSGNIYLVGSTQSTDFPLLHALPLGYGGGTDGFVVRLYSSGNLAYSSYLGGNGFDDARAVAVDSAGNAYVAGVTGSTNFPVVGGGYQSTLSGAADAFVTKVSAAGGAMTYSTYLGGSGTDQANGIAVDSSGNVWVAGLTWSTNFPAVNALQTDGGSEDAFVAKLNATGTGLLFSTYLGGSSLDEATAIAVDGSGNAYVTGSTGSSNFPVTAGVVQSAAGGFFSGTDAFVVKYNSSGSQVSYSTYLGGSGVDIGYGIAADSQGNAYVTGETASSNFPTSGSVSSYAGGTDAFVAVLNPLGTSLLFSSFLGGSGDDSARAIAIDGNGRIYVAGETNSTNFPVVPSSGALQPAIGGGIEDAFVSATQYCTYSVSATNSPFSASGGTGVLTITTAAGCVWSASSSAAWLTLAAPSSGAGNGTVNFTAAPNTTQQTLTATLSAGWQTVQVVESPGVPLLSIVKSHSGSFLQGQQGATYSVTVSNAASAGPTSGPVTVTETVPTGLTLVSMLGTGWTCPGTAANNCTRSNSLAAGGSYDPITVTVNVANNAGALVSNQVSVSGGGSANAGYSDLTTIVPVTAVVVTTSPAGLSVVVDGTTYAAPANLNWSVGSNHTVNVASPQSGGAGVQYVFASWSDSGAQSHTVVGPSSPTTYTASLTTQYYLTTAAGTGGTVSPPSGWYNAGQSVQLSANPGTGYGFASWTGTGTGSYTGTTQSPSVTMNAAIGETASFNPAITVTLQTNPAGLQVTVGGVAQSAPYTWSCTNGSIAVGVPSPRSGAAGVQYLYSGWNDSGAQTRTINCPASSTTYTASFTTQYYLTTTAGTGGTVSPPSGWYNAGQSVQVSASPSTGYGFASWTGTGTGSYTGTTQNPSVTMNAPIGETASFNPAVTVTLQTSPAGLQVTVGGVAQSAPYTWSCTSGSISVGVPSPQSGATGVQYVYKSWSDSGAQTRTINCPASSTTYTASFTTQYYLTTAAGTGGTVSPSSGWYNAGQSVQVSASPGTGYGFASWTGTGTGSYTGTTPNPSVTMNAALGETASFIPITTNTLTAGPASATPGGTFSIPITVALTSGVSIDSLTFGLQITPAGGAPAFSTGGLNFTKASSISQTPIIETANTFNSLAVFWSSLSPTLSGTYVVGSVTGTIPAAAVAGQSYTVTVTAASAGSGGGVNALAVSPGPNATLNVVVFSYLVGDVYSSTSECAPNFGDGALNILDLIQELFAVNSIPNYVPTAGSDRFDAADTYPADTATTRGGDGLLDIRDLIVELFRVNNLDPSRPVRTSRGLVCNPGGQSIQSTIRTSRNIARPPAEVRGVLELGRAEEIAGGQERAPIYLRATQNLVQVALTFGLGDRQSQLHFVVTPDAPPSLLDDGHVGVLAAAWLNGVSVRSGERFLLGYVVGPAGSLANLKLFGASAAGVNDNREVGLDVSAIPLVRQ